MHDLEINQNVLLLLMNSQILEDVQAGISFNVISTLCEGSETLTEWKSESVMDQRTELLMLAHLKIAQHCWQQVLW